MQGYPLVSPDDIEVGVRDVIDRSGYAGTLRRIRDLILEHPDERTLAVNLAYLCELIAQEAEYHWSYTDRPLTKKPKPTPTTGEDGAGGAGSER